MHKFRLWAGTAMFMSMAAWLTLPAAATTIAPMTTDQLAHTAETIVRARCLHGSHQWDGQMISTVYRFEVRERWKGSPPQYLNVRLPGGRHGNLIVAVDGTPVFRANEEAVLFLERNAVGDYSIIAWARGTFRISVTASGETVTQDSRSHAVFDPVARRFRQEGIANVPISVFRRDVVRALSRTNAGASR
jgi:hypothetical protein